MINYIYNYNNKISYKDLINITKKRLDDYLVENNIVEKNEMIDFWSKYLNVTTSNETVSHIKKTTIDKIGLKWVLINRVIPLEETNNKVRVFFSDVDDFDKLMNIEKI